jgi:glycosyltransferase involved in cell wall biosynthesis
MPLIALEALAAGVPVVASAVGGLRELAPHAELVAPDNPVALAAAIERAITAPRRSIDLSDLDWSRVASRLLGHAGRSLR